MSLSGELQDAYGAKVTLTELLNKVPENSWDWRMFEFEGSGVAPQGMAMPDFEDRVMSEEYGFAFSWDSLTRFASELSDVKSCVLAAVSRPVDYESLDDGSGEGVIAFIGIYDSTDWEIKIP